MTNTTITAAQKKKSKGRTFQCSGYPDCNMTFTRSEHLARHIRKHTGERPFECVHCSRKFSRLDNLRQHKQTVHAHEQNSNNNEYNLPKNELNNDEMKIKNEDQQQQQQQQQLYNKENTFLQQASNSSNLPAAAESLLRPTQFRSKHRPRPIALPSRKSVYNDAPYTVPTPRSATSSSHLLLSPISPANSAHQLQFPNGSSNSQQHLPSVQFLTSNGSHADSLISPYNSSFSSNISNTNTPTNSSFDSNSRTPTNPTFTFSKPPQQISTHTTYNNYHDNNNNNNNQHLHEHYHYQQQPSSSSAPSATSSSSSGSSQQQQQLPHRRSWLNNVLNNDQEHQYVHKQPQQFQPSPHYNSYQPAPSHVRQSSSDYTTGNRVRIENLLNSNNNNSNTNASGPTPKPEERLPHAGGFGIDISKN